MPVIFIFSVWSEARRPAICICVRQGNVHRQIISPVSDPPEKPEIQGYMEGETIRMGETVTLVCESYGGNPLASIVWYKNNQRIDHSYTTSGTVCVETRVV